MLRKESKIQTDFIQMAICKYCGRPATNNKSIFYRGVATCGNCAKLREIADKHLRTYRLVYSAKWRLFQ